MLFTELARPFIQFTKAENNFSCDTNKTDRHRHTHKHKSFYIQKRNMQQWKCILIMFAIKTLHKNIRLVHHSVRVHVFHVMTFDWKIIVTNKINFFYFELKGNHESIFFFYFFFSFICQKSERNCNIISKFKENPIELFSETSGRELISIHCSILT